MRIHSNSDLCTPAWLTEVLKQEFPALFDTNDHTLDLLDYIFPIEPDGIMEFFPDSQLMDIFQHDSYNYLDGAVSYLRSVDQLRKEYLPSSHLSSIRSLVSFYLFGSQKFLSV